MKRKRFLVVILLVIVFCSIPTFAVIASLLKLPMDKAAYLVDLLVASGTISMVLIIVYIEIIKPWLRKPRIVIEFDNKAPFCRTAYNGKKMRYYIRLRIQNAGRSVAKKLRGKLVEVTKEDGKVDTDFDPLFLHWTTIEKTRRLEFDPWANFLNPLDLNPTEFDYLDVFDLGEGEEPKERPIKITHTPYQRGCRKDFGMSQITNIFKITIHGENVDPVSGKYRLAWDGKKYDEIRMHKIVEETNDGQVKAREE